VAVRGEGSHPRRDTYPKCFDPYLRYAISTGFKNFDLPDEKKDSSRLFFLVEFNKAGQEAKFAREMSKAGFSVVLGPADDNIRYATLHTTKEAVVEAVPGSLAFDIWEKYVSRVELSLPIKPSSSVAFIRRRLVSRWQKGQGSPGSLLIGVLDDGCPFAAAQILQIPSGLAASTRVRSIWDQNQGKQPVKLKLKGKPCVFGQKLVDFNYGLEFRRESGPPVPTPSRRQIGLDEWIQLHSTSTDSIDEDGCYADARFTRLARRESHGAHVMDVFAGHVPTSSRIGPSPPGDRRDPPNWNLAADPASKADLVFVQFADDCIRDATGVWLKAYVLDGIRYILSFADPNKIDNVVINVSYGPTTGPHDGTAELEAALTALVDEFDGINRKPKLEIVLAAGNAYLSEGHIVYTRHTQQPDHIEWTWRLPPDNSVLCFAEVWIDNASAGPVDVTLTSPSGASSSSVTGPSSPGTGVPLPRPRHPKRDRHSEGFQRARGRWLHYCEWTQVALLVGGPCA
jgi:hypothetical protein